MQGVSDETEAQAPPGSVFGNLPGSRPGTRSPRRDSADAPRKTQARAAKPSPKPRPKAQPAPARPPRPAEPAEQPAADSKSGGGLEDIAWAGVAAAAEAATLGVRLAGRAFEALRGNPERD
jgi:hypothetical protein